MKPRLTSLLIVIALLALAGCETGRPTSRPTELPLRPTAPVVDATQPPSLGETAVAGETEPPSLGPTALTSETKPVPSPEADLLPLISRDSLYGYLEDLTAIQAY